MIGTGSGVRKFDRTRRKTLDHSLPYIFAVALQDGCWRHELLRLPERARRSTRCCGYRRISGPAFITAPIRPKGIQGARGRHYVTKRSWTNWRWPDAPPLGTRPFERKAVRRSSPSSSMGVWNYVEQQRFPGRSRARRSRRRCRGVGWAVERSQVLDNAVVHQITTGPDIAAARSIAAPRNR